MIKPPIWLDFLSRSCFYLALPGVKNPVSHNIIESMAVGVIPITQYGHYLYPSLTDGNNSFSFNEDSLIPLIRRILKLKPQNISKMRDNCISQYNDYFSTKSFQNMLEKRTTSIELLFHAEHITTALFIKEN